MGMSNVTLLYVKVKQLQLFVNYNRNIPRALLKGVCNIAQAWILQK